MGRAARNRGLLAVPDGRQRLSDGLVVEAKVVARLLRIRLLVVDASLVVAPAEVKRPTGEPPVIAPRSHPIGAGLAAAERALSEGAASLERSRR